MSNYGYGNDEQQSSAYSFGLNAGVGFLTKFEWTPNGGAGGSSQEAVDIIFNVNGKDISYRKFPVTKVYNKDRVEFTDPNASSEAKELFDAEFKSFNSCMSHIIKAFVSEEDLKTALEVPIANFKEYIKILSTLLPTGFEKIPLDIFMEYQYNIKGENNQTYLQIPPKTQRGPFLCRAVVPAGGSWKEVRAVNPDDKESAALKYIDGIGNVHPFTRNGWFVNSNYAKKQKEEGLEEKANNASTNTETPIVTEDPVW